MCVIMYKPSGISMPDRETLHNCWSTNNDGAGIMWFDKEKGRVECRKGFMEFDELLDAIHEIGETKEVPVAVHFRITTHGGTSQEFTHPFPVTKHDNVLKATSSWATVALMHNGIIDVTSYEASKMRVSDTFLFVKDYASLICRGKRWYNDRNSVKLLKKLADSKLCIMSADGHTELIGSFVEHEGCFYSNNSFEGWYGKYSTGSYSSYGSSDTSGLGSGWEPYLNREFIPAAMVSNDAWIIMGDTNEMVSGADDFFCVDSHGKAYLYDEETDAIMLLAGARIVGSDEKTKYTADENEFVYFEVVE